MRGGALLGARTCPGRQGREGRAGRACQAPMCVDLVRGAAPLRRVAAVGELLCEPLSTSNLQYLDKRLCVSKGP